MLKCLWFLLASKLNVVVRSSIKETLSPREGGWFYGWLLFVCLFGLLIKICVLLQIQKIVCLGFCFVLFFPDQQIQTVKLKDRLLKRVPFIFITDIRGQSRTVLYSHLLLKFVVFQ